MCFSGSLVESKGITMCREDQLFAGQQGEGSKGAMGALALVGMLIQIWLKDLCSKFIIISILFPNQ